MDNQRSPIQTRNGAPHMTPQRLQRKRTKGWRMPEGAVYVGRGSKWGNPYPTGSMQMAEGDTWVVLNAEGSVALYREHLNARPWGRQPLGATARTELAGKDLACWCPLNKPCHADVLLELANEAGQS